MVISVFPKKHSKILSRRLKTKLCIRIRVPFLSEPCQIFCTVEPRFNEPLFNEVLDITNDIISMSRPKLQ